MRALGGSGGVDGLLIWWGYKNHDQVGSVRLGLNGVA